MLDRIMVALDGSRLAEQALPFASAIASACGAEVILLRVVEGANDGPHGHSLDSFDWRVGRAEAIAYLRAIGETLEQRGIDVDIDVTSGRASDEILELASARGVDLVVIGSHGQHGLTRHKMASTAQKVAFASETSVLVVPSVEGERGGPPFTSVVVPVDGSPHSDWAVAVAAHVARHQGADLVVLHVVRTPTLLDPQGTEREKALLDELVSLNQRAARRYVGKVQRRCECPGMVVHGRVEVAGDIAPVVERHAAAEERPLVVLGALAGSLCEDAAYGSLVTVLLTNARQPVLVLRDGARDASASERWLAPASAQPTRPATALGS